VWKQLESEEPGFLEHALNPAGLAGFCAEGGSVLGPGVVGDVVIRAGGVGGGDEVAGVAGFGV
jgi:hypothetical protein